MLHLGISTLIKDCVFFLGRILHGTTVLWRDAPALPARPDLDRARQEWREKPDFAVVGCHDRSAVVAPSCRGFSPLILSMIPRRGRGPRRYPQSRRIAAPPPAKALVVPRSVPRLQEWFSDVDVSGR
jgi:hypothetical protein